MQVGSSTNGCEEPPRVYDATVDVLGRTVMVGAFESAADAARAHDRALIRALGAARCDEYALLNFPAMNYSDDNMDAFTQVHRWLLFPFSNSPF
jgi:hypothetical protein